MATESSYKDSSELRLLSNVLGSEAGMGTVWQTQIISVDDINPALFSGP